MKRGADQSAQVRTNPIFMTGKTAICLMAKGEIPDADKILRSLKLEDYAPIQNMNDPDIILGNALVVEAKYRTMCYLIKNSGYQLCVDLPCGYTPKALHMSNAGLRFIGLDLPIVVKEIEPIILSIAKNPEQISFHGVDATNYESIRLALENVSGPLCITTEGMMMYFDEYEAEAVISNIRTILALHGGTWITPDPEFMLQFWGSFHSVFGKDSLNKLRTSRENAMQQSDVANLSNPLIVNVQDVEGSTKKAETFVNRHGLKIEKINLAEHIPPLNIYSHLTPAQISNFKEAMRNCHYWAITLDEDKRQHIISTVPKTQPFKLNYALENGILKVSISGRLDSLTAPRLLEAWEDTTSTAIIESAEFDCTGLEYISSAGARVLLILQKALNNNVTLINAKPSITKTLKQKGCCFTE